MRAPLAALLLLAAHARADGRGGRARALLADLRAADEGAGARGEFALDARAEPGQAGRELGMFAVEDIREGDVVLDVPLRHAIAPYHLARANSPLAAPIKDATWHDPCLFATVALLQATWQTDHVWAPYAATIPTDAAGDALWRWNRTRRRELRDPGARALADERNRYLFDTALPLLERSIFPALADAGVPVPPLPESRARDVERAYAGVLSRALAEKADAGAGGGLPEAACALVPLLDLFNHADDGAVVAQLRRGGDTMLRVTATRNYTAGEEVHLTYDAVDCSSPFVSADAHGAAPRCFTDWMLHFGAPPRPLTGARQCATLMFGTGDAGPPSPARKAARAALRLPEDGAANFTVRLGGRLPPALLPWARTAAATEQELARAAATEGGGFRRPLDAASELRALDLVGLLVDSHLRALGNDARAAAVAFDGNEDPRTADAAGQANAGAAMALLNVQDVLAGVREWYASDAEDLGSFARHRAERQSDAWASEAAAARGGEL